MNNFDPLHFDLNSFKNKLYFTSDLHFNHHYIINACKRPFKDVESMNSHYINKLNSLVKKDDYLFILGDMFYKCSLDKAQGIMDQILCKHKVLILGNHDKVSKRLNGWHGIVPYLELNIRYKTNNYFIPMMHYPLDNWNRKHKGKITEDGYPTCFHLHGHEHQAYDYRPGELLIDVGIDPQKGRILSFEDVLEIMKGRVNAV